MNQFISIIIMLAIGIIPINSQLNEIYIIQHATIDSTKIKDKSSTFFSKETFVLEQDVFNSDVSKINNNSSEGCCDNIKIYGDEFDNVPNRIKHFDGFTYFIGSTESNGQTVATFTKLNTHNEIVWEYQLDQTSQFNDFVKTDDDAFLLVGRTLPVQSDNQSILARINDDGTADFIRTYQNVAREALFRIVKHPKPINEDFPYYMAGFENPGPAVSAFDEIHLHNLDAQGNINWSVELDYAADDQWARGLLPLQNGNIALFGDYAPNNRGVVAIVDGSTGMITASVESSTSYIYRQAVELSNGNIAIAGRTGILNGNAMITLLDSDLNFMNSVSINNQAIRDFTELKKGSNDELYTVGISNGGLPIMCKAEINVDQINFTDFAYFTNGESSYSTPTIDITGGSIYYADARTGHPLSYGGQDIFVGYFSDDFSDDCLIDTTFANSVQSLTMNTITPSSTSFNASIPAQQISLVDQNFNWQSIFQTELTLDLGPDLMLCENADFTLNAGLGFESYLWNDFSSDSIYADNDAGTYYVETTDQCGRMYRDTVMVTIDDSHHIDLGDDILLCYDQDTTLAILGDYTDVFWSPSNLVSCDTCLSTDVIVENLVTVFVEGVFEDCISYDTILIERIQPEFDTVIMTSCIGDTIDFFGISISEAGVYENLSADCLNLDVLEINFTTPDTTKQTELICASDSILFDGHFINEQGSYEMHTLNALGCDSTIILNLEVINEIGNFDTLHICETDSIQVFGQWISTDSTLHESYLSSLGCDSIQTISVVMTTQPTNDIQLEICEGDSIFIYDNWYKTDGLNEILVANNMGCDSLIFLEIEFKENFVSFDTITACQGDTVLLFSQSITENQDVSDSFDASNGCDSVSNYHVHFIEALTSIEEIFLCPGDSIFINGNWIKEGGMYETMHTSLTGCDSTHNVFINPVPDPPVPETGINCEDLVIWVSIDPQSTWQPTWSNGDTSFQSFYENGVMEASLMLNAQPNCEKLFTITLPQLPELSDIPFLADTTIIKNESIIVDLGLDTSQWSVLWNNTSIIDCDTCMQVLITPTEFTEITIYLEHESGCMYETTFVIRIEEEKENMYIPNAFTPNSDNLNDEWIIFLGDNIQINACAIYDRWGNLVYSSFDEEPIWDGKLNGKNCQQGVYGYMVKYIDSAGKEQLAKGSLTILR